MFIKRKTKDKFVQIKLRGYDCMNFRGYLEGLWGTYCSLPILKIGVIITYRVGGWVFWKILSSCWLWNLNISVSMKDWFLFLNALHIQRNPRYYNKKKFCLADQQLEKCFKITQYNNVNSWLWFLSRLCQFMNTFLIETLCALLH